MTHDITPDQTDLTSGPQHVTPARADLTPGANHTTPAISASNHTTPDGVMASSPHAAGPDRVDATGPRKSEAIASRAPRWRRVVLGSALVVGLVAAAGLGTTAWRIGTQKNTVLNTPPEVPALVGGGTGGKRLTRDDSQRARSTADYLRDGLAADIALDRSIGAVYNDPADARRSVLLFGGTTLLWQPERDLDRLFRLVAGDGAKPGELRKVAAGEFGGVMKCGTQDGDLAVCGWADHGSVVFAMFPGRGVAESAGLLRAIRGVVQTRS